MASLNKFQAIGNLGQDVDVRYSASGDAIANFSIACSEQWTDKNSGQEQQKTEWIRAVAFKRLGEIAGEYLRKGSKVYIEGKMQTRKWDKNGVDMYTTEVLVKELIMLDSKASGSSSGGAGSGSQANQNGQGGVQASQASQPKGQINPQHNQGGPNTDFDDDVPF